MCSFDNFLVENKLFSSSGVGDYRIKRTQAIKIENTAY